MKSSRCFAFSLALALGVPACNSERSERVAASYSSAAKRTERPFPKPARAQQSPIGIDAVPVEEEYEARAASTITEDNLTAKLAEIEQELRL
jgi:hypothetical protein